MSTTATTSATVPASVADAPPDPAALAADPELVRLARRVGRSMARRMGLDAEADDLESAALLGLAEAARSFDPANAAGATFKTHATNRVRGAVLDEVRRLGGGGFGGGRTLARRRASIPVLSLDAPRAGGDSTPRVGKVATLGEAVPSGELPVGWELESEDEVRSMLRRARPRGVATAAVAAVARSVAADYFLRADRATLRDAAGARGLSPPRACQLVNGLLADLRGRGGGP